ncbi:MAG: carbamoyltransferase HypF [Deltaproteobacteria bacterium]|nr:carbamoyltransferase HypF [Deltaproteobacteria bacterium]
MVRKRFLFEGIVQGVGFRPFIWRLANRNGLVGFVQNRSDGVAAEVEGPAGSVEAFLAEVKGELPPLADLVRITQSELAVKNSAEEGFTIAQSDATAPRNTHISPDAATCEECIAELFDPADRRFGYPFINCTNCGPRLTIIDAIPYDRVHTSMACFPFCPRCREEYENPADRRFHAEPNACPVCGPHLELIDGRGSPMTGADPIRQTLSLLKQGAILAVKGLGGFHLCVDGRNDKAVAKLRLRKFREEKPLAVMVRDLRTAALLAEVGEAEQRLLTAPERPIVIIRRRPGAPVSPLVAPGTDTLGIMLPYTPLQHLLLAGELTVLVMTSANRNDEPICIGNREALRRLEGIADAFLIHNRDILVRCDDSVVTTAAGGFFPLRRSRGYAPKPISLREPYPEVLALGPEIKATACVVKHNFAFPSPHIGDLSTPEARDFLQESIALLERMTECRPHLVACDLHPDYHTSRIARQMEGRRIFAVQHHHAHIVSCMAENRLAGKVIGLAMDGTGFGTDGQVWGGEFLTADERGFTRRGHLLYIPMPGGEKAIREPWRMAASLLREAFGGEWMEMARRLKLHPGWLSPSGSDAEAAEKALAGLELAVSNRMNSPLTSSLGRLFDGVAALVGLRRRVSFEGQAAMELESLARGRTNLTLPFDIGEASQEELRPHSEEQEPAKTLDLRPAIRAIADSLLSGLSPAEIALAFHNLLPRAFTTMAETIRAETGLNRVVLSGGCFQNRILLEGCVASLDQAGFATYHHRLVPTNDGGISLGQAICAGASQKEPAR